MSESYPFPTYSGLLEPKHYENIGMAIWLFLWCISSTTKEVQRDGITWGIVLGSKPVKIDYLSKQFNINRSTIKRWVDTLEEHDYIRVTRAPYGLIFEVRNSKKYTNQRQLEIAPSEQRDSSKMHHLLDSDGANMNHQQCKNEPSNKDIIKTLIDRLIDGLNDVRFSEERCGVLTTVVASLSTRQIHLDDQTISIRAAEIERYYMARKNRIHPVGADWVPIQRISKMPIPMEYITFGIDLAFARHALTKRWPTDEINQFAYCEKVIIGTWNRLLSDIAAYNSPAEAEVVPIGQAQRRTGKQRRLDDLRRKAKEERERGQS
ncbi:hypothetical protein COLU111180_04285 [Cohnella lubricantis]|uniref:Uncharacterized protein n=1 Tax=Cohnella lubricantis TaxID=2163172 RepID=A0A841T8Y0_9BACL|nr:hypothetical protein [Cohnella lubricantis]MBB6676475.1 hypothetical protein [Cohnella lubricantis]MBP2117092.1 hypothetical protein [Cohnella lubricantis]